MNFKDLLDEINKCINNKTYYAALTLSLIIPDVCSQVLYELDKGNGKCYRQWFDEYVGKKEDMLYQQGLTKQHDITGNVIWDLRNNVFHCGLPTSNKGNNYIYYFDFSESRIWYRLYTERSGIIKVTINVPYLCQILYKVGKEFYSTNKDKFAIANNWEDALPNILKVKKINDLI